MAVNFDDQNVYSKRLVDAQHWRRWAFVQGMSSDFIGNHPCCDREQRCRSSTARPQGAKVVEDRCLIRLSAQTPSPGFLQHCAQEQSGLWIRWPVVVAGVASGAGTDASGVIGHEAYNMNPE